MHADMAYPTKHSSHRQVSLYPAATCLVDWASPWVLFSHVSSHSSASCTETQWKWRSPCHAPQVGLPFLLCGDNPCRVRRVAGGLESVPFCPILQLALLSVAWCSWTAAQSLPKTKAMSNACMSFCPSPPQPPVGLCVGHSHFCLFFFRYLLRCFWEGLSSHYVPKLLLYFLFQKPKWNWDSHFSWSLLLSHHPWPSHQWCVLNQQCLSDPILSVITA